MPVNVMTPGQFAIQQKQITLSNIQMIFTQQGANAQVQITATITPDQIADSSAAQTPITTGACGVFTFNVQQYVSGFPPITIIGNAAGDTVTFNTSAATIMTGGVKGTHGTAPGLQKDKKNQDKGHGHK